MAKKKNKTTKRRADAETSPRGISKAVPGDREKRAKRVKSPAAGKKAAGKPEAAAKPACPGFPIVAIGASAGGPGRRRNRLDPTLARVQGPRDPAARHSGFGRRRRINQFE